MTREDIKTLEMISGNCALEKAQRDMLKAIIEKEKQQYVETDHTCEDLTFTVHYSDGTSRDIETGILFSIDGEDKMDIHVGTSKWYHIYGCTLCQLDFINSMGKTEEYNNYLNAMFAGGLNDVMS